MKKEFMGELDGNHVHFIGIGGISMSGLAEILLDRGYRVSGSDLKQTHLTNKLENKGIKIFYKHDASNISGAHWVVYTNAVHDDNPEILAARKKGLPIIERAGLLGRIMEAYPYSVGIAGSHGKTTTTAMLSVILSKADMDPTVLVGGDTEEIGGNVRIGKSSYFVTEACEYRGSFLNFEPYIAVILNIDRDHLDYFKDISGIYDTFKEFADLIRPSGTLIGCADDPLVSKLMKDSHNRKNGFAIDNKADWMARDIKYNEMGHPSFRVSYKGQDMGRTTLNIPGQYNIYNALAAWAAAWALGAPADIIRDSLSSFKGTHRRFEIKGSLREVTIIDDYAHHPTEVQATLKAARNFPHKKIWCVFQPHTYTRTEKLFYEFSESFADADEILVTDIYAAREDPIEGITSDNLAKAINASGKSCRYMSSFDEAALFLSENAQPGDLVFTMGAGDIHEVGEKFLKTHKPVGLG